MQYFEQFKVGEKTNIQFKNQKDNFGIIGLINGRSEF